MKTATVSLDVLIMNHEKCINTSLKITLKSPSLTASLVYLDYKLNGGGVS